MACAPAIIMLDQYNFVAGDDPRMTCNYLLSPMLCDVNALPALLSAAIVLLVRRPCHDHACVIHHSALASARPSLCHGSVLWTAVSIVGRKHLKPSHAIRPLSKICGQMQHRHHGDNRRSRCTRALSCLCYPGGGRVFFVSVKGGEGGGLFFEPPEPLCCDG